MVSHFAGHSFHERLFRQQVFLNVLRVHSFTKSDASLSYLIDFENSFYDESVNFTNWAHLGAHLSHPDEILKYWGLEMLERPEK